jgi:hypothetical protein
MILSGFRQFSTSKTKGIQEFESLNIPRHQRTPKVTIRSSELKFNLTRFMIASDQQNDFQNIMAFLTTISASPAFKMYPGTDTVLHYMFVINDYRFKRMKRQIYCACGSNIVGFTKWSKNNSSGKCKPLYFFDKWKLVDRIVPLLPSCINDSVQLYLFKSRSCCPECRVISFLRKWDYRPYPDHPSHNMQAQDKLSYLLAFYTNMTRMAFLQTTMQYENDFDFWERTKQINGYGWDFNVEMFWKLYVFTLYLTYESLSSDEFSEFDVSLSSNGIGFNFFDLNKSAEDASQITMYLDKGIEQIQAAYYYAIQAAASSQRSSRTKGRDLENDYCFYENIVKFLSEKDYWLSNLLAKSIKECTFNPFVRLDEYRRSRKKRKYIAANRAGSSKVYKKKIIKCYDETLKMFPGPTRRSAYTIRARAGITKEFRNAVAAVNNVTKRKKDVRFDTQDLSEKDYKPSILP